MADKDTPRNDQHRGESLAADPHVKPGDGNGGSARGVDLQGGVDSADAAAGDAVSSPAGEEAQTTERGELIAAREQLGAQEKMLKEKEALLREYEDLLKRKQAEFENFRKRMQKELEDYRKYATSDLVLDILSTMDDLERAIDSAKSSRDFDVLLDGIMMVEKQLRAILEKKHGVEKIQTVGEEFDPTVHDAIMMEESEDHEEDTVVEAFQSGYRMHDRVLRPAKVKVAKAVSADEQERAKEMRESSEKGE
jgi:molecular chaperone GrpE